MKKRVNITIDAQLHEWFSSHFSGAFSRIIQENLILMSSSYVEEKKNFMNYREPEAISRDFSEKDIADFEEFYKAYDLYKRYYDSEDGYPLNFDVEKMKRIAHYLNDRDENLTRKKYTAFLMSVFEPKFKQMILEMSNILVDEIKKVRENSLNSIKESKLEQLAKALDPTRGTNE
jgi:hypothetical protein